jgi:ADP-ribose pyrophosphatase YjhB (NUDIX family)
MLLRSMSWKGWFKVARLRVSLWAWPVGVIVVIAVAGQIGPIWAFVATGVLTISALLAVLILVRRSQRLGSKPVTTEQRHIRPLALGVIRRGNELLVFEGHDHVKGETYYRPLGGGIEFGEAAEDALRREFREELAAELTNVSLLGVVENIFTVFGRPSHEIVFLFEAELADRAWYEREELGTVIDEGSPVFWRDFTSGDSILYPAGLRELMSAEV